MKIKTAGDYFVWYCDWCDSTNQVHWSGMSRQRMRCSVCHHPHSDSDVEAFGPLPCAA